MSSRALLTSSLPLHSSLEHPSKSYFKYLSPTVAAPPNDAVRLRYHIRCLCICQRTRAQDSSKHLSLHIDALGHAPSGPGLRGRFVYFNGTRDNLPSAPGEVGYYGAVVKIVKATPDVLNVPDAVKTADKKQYNIAGDVMQCYRLPGDLANSPPAKDRAPLIIASDTVVEADYDAYTFALDIPQLTQITRDAGRITIVVNVPDRRFKDEAARRRAIPGLRTMVSVIGFFSPFAEAADGTISHVVIVYDSAAFLGKTAVFDDNSTAPSNASNNDTSTSTAAFDFFGTASQASASQTSAKDKRKAAVDHTSNSPLSPASNSPSPVAGTSRSADDAEVEDGDKHENGSPPPKRTRTSGRR
ncbi:unnamed protein product [Peniophora sp. CBMAI 1063]|nr:unnamed protein product [Peniophora sp. CBMAI 1063]